MEDNLKEIVIVSGKGGTGKTSLAAAFAAIYGKKAVLADCDVDASNLYILLQPLKTLKIEDFWSGHEAAINPATCNLCLTCLELCRFGAIRYVNNEGNEKRKPLPHEAGRVIVDTIACEGCGVCVHFCPQKAVSFPEKLCGQWMISESRLGTFIHAKLKAGGENSGKLVATVRKVCRDEAVKRGSPCIIVDGPPGIGCPVISSITGASIVVVVAEPTLSGEHDTARILRLAKHFGIPALVCINKWDINPEVTEKIEEKAQDLGASTAGRISYNPLVTKCQIEGYSVMEAVNKEHLKIQQEFANVWEKVRTFSGL